jgi:hypothetical protein
MKNRKLLYLLVPLVIILWGVIIVKIFRHFNQSSMETPIVAVGSNLSDENQIADTISIIANYSDPFLERNIISTSDRPNELAVKDNANQKQNLNVSITWPKVQYKGMIINNGNNNVLYLINIDGKNHLLKKGSLADNIILSKVFKDSIVIQFEKKYKTITKE